MFRVAYIVSHPIQYQAPLLRFLANSGEIALKVFFLSDFSFGSYYDEGFNQTFKWNTGLSDDYDWELLPRCLLGPQTARRTYWPLRNLHRVLRLGRFDALWVHGWGHVGLIQAVHAASMMGLPVLLRGDSTADFCNSSTLRRRLSNAFCSRLFQRVSGFLSIGTLNRNFYRCFGVPDDHIFSMPYAVDNEFFQRHCREAAKDREKLRSTLGLEKERTIILFVGRLAREKAPEDLLTAWMAVQARWDTRPPYLVFIGDGPLRSRLERLAGLHAGNGVRFLGFRNQLELPAFYDLCDMLVLPSHFEPWGLVLNEVMNAAKPLVASDHVGAASDLIDDGVNGFVYRAGDLASLADSLHQLSVSGELRLVMGQRSLERIDTWNFSKDRQGLIQALTAVSKRRSPTVSHSRQFS